jgi:hypothetical protein
MQHTTLLFVWAVVAHLIADWLLQTDWMVQHKTSLRHPAAWVHGSIHVLALCFVVSWSLALLLGLTHILIDTRQPVLWWKRLVGKTAVGPQTLLVEIAVDQVIHALVLAAVIGVAYRG